MSGGAGGKGVWGKLGDELSASGRCQDSMDPNYDSESEVLDFLTSIYFKTILIFVVILISP